MVKTGLGQDSHAFETQPNKPLILGGVVFDTHCGLKGNSDSDVVLHALTNAISSITGVPILGAKADTLCAQGITDSSEYLKLAQNTLDGWQINHIAISIECSTPKISPKIPLLKSNIARLMGLRPDNIGITATTGEALSAVGRGEGISVISILSVSK